MIANIIARIVVSVIWWVYLYRNILTSLLYFRYYDVDNKVIKVCLLILYHFSDEVVSFLFLTEYIRIFLSMRMMEGVNLYKYIRWIEYKLLTSIIYPYYGMFMLNTSSKVMEMMMIITVLNLYGDLNRIVYMRVYSKYKKSNYCVGSKDIKLYYFCDYIRDEISEYYKVRRKMDRYCVYVLIGYTVSLISYNIWVYTFYLYYLSLIVVNYSILDRMLYVNTRIKENEKYYR